jgi:glycosyltransferase involved in cell wall biosynthesis
VVDNGSLEPIETVTTTFRVVLSTETRPGSYAARNTGVSLAKGDVIAFADSDCIPYPDWIEEGVKALFASPGTGLVGGKIVLSYKNPRRPTAAELYETVHAFRQDSMVHQYHHAATANMFTFKHVFDEVGPFDDTVKSGGDVDWGRRVFAAGYRQIYSPTARVVHPARHSLADLCRKTARVTGGVYQRKGSAFCFLMTTVSNVSRFSVRLLALGKRAILGQPPFDRMYGATQPIRYLYAVVLVDLVRILETIRLRGGAVPRRN